MAWVFDFGRLVTAFPDLDWTRVARAARACGAERALLLALRLARDLTGATPPPSLAARVAEDRPVSALANQVQAGLRGERSVTEPLWRLQAFHLMVQDRLRDRVRYLTRLLFTSGPADWELIALPGWLAWLYPLIKPLRLVSWAVTGGNRR